jgi:hypothetical protein
MKVKMLARWSELSPRAGQNRDREEAELKRIIDGDEGPAENIIMMDIIHEYGPVVFDLHDVVRFNRAKEKDHTTVNFKGGDSLVLKVTFSDFATVMMEQLGIGILDCTPLDYVDDGLEDEDYEEGNEDDLEL